MIKVRIEHENDNRTEYGYGVYVNGYVTDSQFDPPFEPGLYASECVPFNADDERIKRAERRVRQNARRAYLREWNKDRQ